MNPNSIPVSSRTPPWSLRPLRDRYGGHETGCLADTSELPFSPQKTTPTTLHAHTAAGPPFLLDSPFPTALSASWTDAAITAIHLVQSYSIWPLPPVGLIRFGKVHE